MTTFAELQAACRGRPPEVTLVLGSGMGPLADRVEPECVLPFGEIPGLPRASVLGHRGQLRLGSWAGRRVLLFEGRLHYYEGHPWDVVARPIRLAAELGAAVAVLTNAAGGIAANLDPGSLMALTDHIECNHPHWWRSLRTTTSPYSSRLRERLQLASRESGVVVAEGVYAALTGPCFETPAEIRALRAWGADAVGMSTAREIRAAHEAGLECAAVSLIANKAAGLSDGPLDHEEVLTNAAAAARRLGDLLERFLAVLA